MQFQYFLIVCLLVKDVLPTTVKSHRIQSENRTRCPMLHVKDKCSELENKSENRTILFKIISEKGESLVNGITDTSTGRPNDEPFFETKRESNGDFQNSFNSCEHKLICLETPPVVNSEPIVSKLLSQSRKIGMDSSSKLWLNFPIQVGLEIKTDNNENTLYKIKSLSSDNDCFEFDDLFHGREYSTHRNPLTENLSPTRISFSSPKTQDKIYPPTRLGLHLPFHLKPPLQIKDSSVSPSSVNDNNIETTQKFETNVTRSGHRQLNFTTTTTKSETIVTTRKTTQSHENPVFVNTPSIHGHPITSSSPPTELSITVGSQAEFYKSTTKKITTYRSLDQPPTTLWNQNNIDIPYLNNLNPPTITYPDIDHHKSIISKLKDFLKRRFGKKVASPPLYSEFDLEGFLNNYDLQNLNVSLPFPSIEAITLPQDQEQFLKKSKLKKFVGRFFGNSTVTAKTFRWN